jgi:hypothetical protein
MQQASEQECNGEGSSVWWREGVFDWREEMGRKPRQSLRLGTDGRGEDRAVQRIVCLP